MIMQPHREQIINIDFDRIFYLSIKNEELKVRFSDFWFFIFYFCGTIAMSFEKRAMKILTKVIPKHHRSKLTIQINKICKIISNNIKTDFFRNCLNY